MKQCPHDSGAEQPRSGKLAFGVEPSHRTYRLRLARYKTLAEAVATFVKERDGQQTIALLDVGFGRGRSVPYIQAEGAADRIDFYGLDIIKRRSDSVFCADRWRMFQGDIQEGTSFESGRFDIVICEQVLEHVSNPVAALDEIARVLKPGGLLVLGVPVFPPGVTHLRRLGVRAAKRWFGKDRSHVQSFSCGSIKRMVRAHGRFAISDCYGVRIVSGGLTSALEDCRWWYRFSRWLGRIVPSLCAEVQIVGRRNSVS
jgi:SAM-dependent methyltransferase